MRLCGPLRVLSLFLGAFGGGNLVQALTLGGSGFVGGVLFGLSGGSGFGFLGFAGGALLGFQLGALAGKALILSGAGFAGESVLFVAAGAGGLLLLLECLALCGQSVGFDLLFGG